MQEAVQCAMLFLGKSQNYEFILKIILKMNLSGKRLKSVPNALSGLDLLN